MANARERLSALVDRARRTLRRCLARRRGQPQRRSSVSSLRREIEADDRSGVRPAGALALVGAWGDVPDDVIDTFLAEVLRSRAEQMGRPVDLEP